MAIYQVLRLVVALGRSRPYVGCSFGLTAFFVYTLPRMDIRHEQLKKTSKTFPNKPGVYFWRNQKGEPLYIGRAGSLKKRIANYFLTNKLDPRIREMTEATRSLDYETTDTLLEAIVLEANLIKLYWPKYNVLEKDGKSFMYLVITDEEFPRLLMVRGRELQRYETGKIKTLGIFGPYQSFYLLRKALELVRRIFPYSNCKPGQLKPCFHNQIGLCPGVCTGAIDAKAYRENIRNIILFFRGEKRRLRAKLQKENPEAILALKQVSDTALLADSDVLLRGHQITQRRIEGYDISHLKGKEPVGSMVVFENGEKDPSQYRLFKIRAESSLNHSSEWLRKKISTEDDLAMLEQVLRRRLNHPEWPMPDIVFIDGGANQVRRAVKVLTEHNVHVPVVGLSKAGKHAGSAFSEDKLVIANSKKPGRELLIASKRLFQEVRNEAHRFAIGFQRKRRGKAFISKGWIR
jgi:excinuclease UvrABC nuclease subunit